MPDPEKFFKGAQYIVRRDGSGKIEWTNLRQLANIDLGQVLLHAQEAQRDERHAVSLILTTE